MPRFTGRRRLQLDAVPAAWFHRVLKKGIVVHLRDGTSIEGVLMECAEDGLILRAAKLLGENGVGDMAMAGETFIPEENVAFAQLDE